MTKAKIAITLPKDQLKRVRGKVRAGSAASVSGYISGVLAKEEESESLRDLLRDMDKRFGAPSPEDYEWARRALTRRKR